MNSCSIPILGHSIDYWLNYCGSTERSLITRNRKLVPFPVIRRLLNMFMAMLLRLSWIPWSAAQPKGSVSFDITPCSSLKVNRRFRGTYCLHLQGWLVSQTRKEHETGSSNRPSDQQTHWPTTIFENYKMLKWVRHGSIEERLCWPRFACYLLHAGFLSGFPSTVKMKETCFSETSFDFERIRLHHIPKDWTLHNNLCENHKS
jgi:hypothetical protein